MTLPLVYLVGAGPGNPELLTLRAVACLARADVVLYDQLVPERILEYAPATAKRICLKDLATSHVERCPHVHEIMVDAARQGKCVVRLKGGDPFIFGRGGEEAEVLHEANIPYEIVPGITAGLGAAVYAGIPLTHRLHSSAVALVTGHEDPVKHQSALDWSILARFPGTLVIYMGVARLTTIVEALLANGKRADTPAAVIEWATTSRQRTVAAPLIELPGKVTLAGLHSPALVIVGDVVALRSRLTWFERRPLLGKRVLVTRPREQGTELIRRLEELGAEAVALPLIDIREPLNWSRADAALANLNLYQWLIFTSANGVHGFMHRLRNQGMDARALGSLRLATIGPKTADAIRFYYLEPDLIPPNFRSEALAGELFAKVTGLRVLLAGTDRGRDLLGIELAKVATVDHIVVYTQVENHDIPVDLVHSLNQGDIPFVTVTSSNIARALGRLLNDAGRKKVLAGEVKLVSISPVTSATLREAGLPVAGEATTYTAEGIIEALLRLI